MRAVDNHLLPWGVGLNKRGPGDNFLEDDPIIILTGLQSPDSGSREREGMLSLKDSTRPVLFLPCTRGTV